MNKNKKQPRNCKMCGIQLPSSVRYDTDWCWMCWRRIWEADYDRYYLRKPQLGESKWITYWEEVQSLRGVFFSEKNRPLIQKEMAKAKKNA